MASIFNLYPKPRITIERAFEDFLEYQRIEVPGRIHLEYENIINFIKAELNERGTHILSHEDLTYFESRRNRTFCKLFGPEKIMPTTRKILEDLDDLPSNDLTGAKITADTVQYIKGFLRRLNIWVRRERYNAE